MATKKRRAAGAAIDRYIKRHGLSQKQFADRLGITQSAVSQWIQGDTGVRNDIAVKIVRLTGGEVSLSDLYPHLFMAG